MLRIEGEIPGGIREGIPVETLERITGKIDGINLFQEYLKKPLQKSRKEFQDKPKRLLRGIDEKKNLTKSK